MVRLKPRTRGERGAIALLTSLMTIPLVLSAAFVVDLGMARETKGRAQNAADASALAAGNALYDDAGEPDFSAAVAAARTYAAENFGVTATAWENCRDAGHLTYTPESECISFDDATRPAEVRVRVPVRQVGTAFAGLTGVNEIPVAASATAALDPAVVIKCSLCVIGEGPHTLGNGDVTVTASSVHFNGSVSTGPNGVVEAIDNQITVESTATGNYEPDAEKISRRIGDPLAGLDLPAPAGQAKTDPCAEGPGAYGAYDFGNTQNCQLQPGVYVITTGVWTMGNHTILEGAGVTIYAACGTPASPRRCAEGEAGGAFDAHNGDRLNISAGAPGFGDLAIVYDRNNTSDIHVQGNGETSITGTVYAPKSMLYANGNSGNGVVSGSIVVDSIYLNGETSHLKVTDGIDREWRFPPEGLHLSE